jgi:hypothetical protein
VACVSIEVALFLVFASKSVEAVDLVVAIGDYLGCAGMAEARDRRIVLFLRGF